MTSQISSSIRPSECFPIDTGDAAEHHEGGGGPDAGTAAEHADGEQVIEEGNHEAGDEDREFERQRPLRDPGMPTQEEIDEHNLSHINFRPWCEACVKARAKDRKHVTVKGAFAEELIPRVRMDYAFLTDADGGTSAEPDADEVDDAGAEEELKQTILVCQESECSSVWSYAV